MEVQDSRLNISTEWLGKGNLLLFIQGKVADYLPRKTNQGPMNLDPFLSELQHGFMLK
jgi:hypothetical protein